MDDILEETPNVEKALPLDPFGAKPSWASLIDGLGGTEPAPDPSYVFLTLDCRPALGRVRATIRFTELRATCGTLLFEVRARSAVHSAEHARLETVAVEAKQLVESGGIVELNFESYRNAYYAIACSINDETDLNASHISVSLDRRATREQHGKDWDWAADRGPAWRRSEIDDALIDRLLTDLALPCLEQPMSQVASPLQCREQAFLEAMGALQRHPSPTYSNWSLAYVVQAIKRYSGEGHARILAYGEEVGPLLSYFAGRDCEVVRVQHSVTKNRPDPGEELQKLWIPELCGEDKFFEGAHYTYGDIRKPIEEFRDQFDVICSIGANRIMMSNEYIYFVVNGLFHLRPGGTAVHVFDYVEGFESDLGTSLNRHKIEQVAALALSHKNDVARLQFRHDARTPDQAIALPFGLVLIRGGPPF